MVQLCEILDPKGFIALQVSSEFFQVEMDGAPLGRTKLPEPSAAIRICMRGSRRQHTLHLIA